MNEIWEILEEFPDYAVSNQGRVRNIQTDLLKIGSPNKQGIHSVLLMKDKKQHRRAIAGLVAHIFIPRPYPHFDTPINLNGDRSDNRVENLAWRPRWFAIKYHKQFKPGYVPGFNRPIRDIKTRIEYLTSLHAASTFGLIDNEIVLATLNRTFVFPTNQMFELVDW